MTTTPFWIREVAPGLFVGPSLMELTEFWVKYPNNPQPPPLEAPGVVMSMGDLWYAMCALNRACVSLELQADRLQAAMDYNAEFPGCDAQSLRKLLKWLGPPVPPEEPDPVSEEEYAAHRPKRPLRPPPPPQDWRTAPWLSKTADLKEVSDGSLKRALLTPDGGGVEFKVKVLDELLDRNLPF